MNTIARVGVPGLTKVQNAIQIALLIALSIITGWMLYMIPSWQAAGDPFLLAAVASAVTVACLWLTRWLGSRAVKFERALLAAFLVGMPLVYVMGWFAGGNRAASSWSVASKSPFAAMAFVARAKHSGYFPRLWRQTR